MFLMLINFITSINILLCCTCTPLSGDQTANKVVPESLYDKLLDKLSEKNEEVGALRVKLKRVAGLNAVVMAYDVLEDFRDNVLFPRYLESKHSNISAIKAAYRAFLADGENPLSQQMMQRISKYPNLFPNVEEFISQATEAFSKTSRVIHTCSYVFRTLHSFSAFFKIITDIPTLSTEQETAVVLISYVVPLPQFDFYKIK